MVFVFVSTSVSPPALLFMGEHQEENELLFKGGYPDDVWFHVDSMSSAHVYLRLPRGMSIEHIPEKLLEDCCQLVKQNSINGSKKDNVKVVYTERANLKKTNGMEVGQIGFHNSRVLKLRDTDKKHTNQIIRRLQKTRLREPIG